MNFLNNLATSVFLYIYVILNSTEGKKEFQLELLQILFRHGDRTPEKFEVYKTDPYDPEAYIEYGYGQLTRAGKQRTYKLGRLLRQRYDDFLGDLNHDEVYAESANLNRTKMSLRMVLAGLHPRTSALWSSVPLHTEDSKKSLLNHYWSCPRWLCSLHDAMKSPQSQRLLEKHKDFIGRVSNAAEVKITKLMTMSMLYNNLRSILSLGLPLPDWCSGEDYEEITGLHAEFTKLYTATRLMEKIAVGPVVEKFLNNIHDQARAKKGRDVGKKIYLYAGHDHNVIGFANVHNFTYKLRYPDYGCTIVVEKLRNREDRVYLRMFLWTGVSEKWIPLKLNDCDYECPLSRYEKIMNWVLPDSDSEDCDAPDGCGTKDLFTLDHDLVTFKYGNQ